MKIIHDIDFKINYNTMNIFSTRLESKLSDPREAILETYGLAPDVDYKSNSNIQNLYDGITIKISM
jgi:hypothetical protein